MPSDTLLQKKCLPCEVGMPPLSSEEAHTLAQSTPTWTLAGDVKSIYHEWKFKNFKEAMRFVNLVADIAESEGHHPDIYIWYNKVKLELSTHAIGGLSENDFILAAKIDNRIDNKIDNVG